MARAQRSLYWATLIYPESGSTENIKEYLSNRGVCFFLSPLHNKDVNDDGTPKKPHYHLLLKFASLKSSNQIQSLLVDFTMVLPIVVSNLKQYARYLIHADNEEKFQYNFNDVVTNANYSTFFSDEFATTSLTELVHRVSDGQKVTDILLEALHSNNLALVEAIKKNTHLINIIRFEKFEKDNQTIKQ